MYGWVRVYQVAVECKLGEMKFGSCSRPMRELVDPQYCDGSYTIQRERTKRCVLSQNGVLYWLHLEKLFGWSSEIDHLECPLNATYQLVRNVLAACLDEKGMSRLMLKSAKRAWLT